MRIGRFDEVDLRILTELQRDGRITFQELSQIVGLSPRPCLERVRRLERDGVITGYIARIDVMRLVNPVLVIAQILVKPGGGAHARFEQQICVYPEVVECFEVSGAFDYIIKVVSASLHSYQELTERWVNDAFMQVERIESHVVLRRAKDDEVYPLTMVQSQIDQPT
jgi:DNA-binding Lrp family transcriptional regulator